MLVSKQEAGINPGDSTKKHKTTRHKFSAPNHESSVEEQELLWHRRRTLALASGGVNGLDEVVPSTTRRLVSNTPSTVICYNDNFSYTYVCRPDPNVAWFESGTFDLEDGTWRNEIAGGTGAPLVGSGLNEVREAGHGAIRVVTALHGTTTDTIDFGDVIKTEFTICSVTRYTGDAKGRILNGEGANWLHGHHKGHAGMAYYDKGITADINNVEPNTNWVVMCGTNAGSQLKLVNGVDKGTGTGGQGGVRLLVNNGGSQKSDFAIAEVMVWDRGLTDDELVAASDYLMNKFGLFPNPIPDVAWFKSGTFDEGHWTNSVSGYLDVEYVNATMIGNDFKFVEDTGHGAQKQVWALEGTTSDVINFGAVIKDHFTICSVTRYTGSANQNRILQGKGRNWLHGHHNGNAGVAYYDGWTTADRNNVEPNTNWAVMCGTNALNAGSKLKLVNGLDESTKPGGKGGVELMVNGGDYADQTSDFAIAEVMVWERVLTDQEIYLASDYLMNKFGLVPAVLEAQAGSAEEVSGTVTITSSGAGVGVCSSGRQTFLVLLWNVSQ